MGYLNTDDINLPREIYTPSDTPGYKPAYTGREAMDLNIVVEGGALRGMFAAGALDFFIDMGIWGKNVIGVSAGALCGFNYVAGSRGRNCYINVRFCNEWRYLSMRSYLETGNVYGIKFAFFDVPNLYCHQDNEGFMKSPSKLYAVTANLQTGKAEYNLVVDPKTDWKYLQASSAMPFVSQISYLNGTPSLDGGIADSIPIDFSLSLGAKKHVVLLTQTRDFEKEPEPLYRLGKYKYKDYPNFVETMNNRHVVYNYEHSKVIKLHDEGKIFAIYPKETPQVSHIETDRCKIFDLYMEGYLEAQRQWPALKEYLEL